MMNIGGERKGEREDQRQTWRANVDTSLWQLQWHSLPCARPLHLSEQLLLDCLQEVGPKVAWVEENLMLQCNLCIKEGSLDTAPAIMWFN